MHEFTSIEIVGLLGSALGAGWIFYKEVYKKNQESRIANKKALSEADILAQQNILQAYTKLNDNVFDLFKTYLTDMRKDLVETKADVTVVKNLADMSDRQHDDIITKINEISIKLEAASIRFDKKKDN